MLSEGFQIVDAERKGSFKEVTDEEGSGQRKFARWWCRAAERNFSSLSASGTVDHDGRIQRRGERLFPRHTSSTEK